MVGREGTDVRQRKRESSGLKKKNKAYNRWTYFFHDGDLHQALHIDRSGDVATCWNYPKGQRVTLPYAVTKKNSKRAWKLSEAARMLNHERLALERAIGRGDVRMPQYTYGIDENRKKYQYRLTDEDVLEFHRYFLTVHRGRPRKDGLITPIKMPNERELRAMLRQQTVLYVKTGDGFVPTWEADF